MGKLALALALTAIVLVAGGVWLVLRPGDEASAPAHATMALVAAVDPDAGEPERRLAAREDGLLRVSSAEDVPLAWIELETGAAWTRLALAEGAVAIAPAQRPALLRAPGHVATAVARGEERVALECDALLAIDAPWLRDALVEVTVEDSTHGRSPLEPAEATWGFGSDGVWRLAMASGAGRRRRVALRLDLGGYVTAHVRPAPGLRALAALEPERPPTAPLELEIVGHSTDVELELSAVLDRRASGRVHHNEEWGTWLFRSADEFRHRLVVPADRANARIEGVPLDRQLELAILQPPEHERRLAFVHRGSAQVLRLWTTQAEGRIVARHGWAPWRSVEIRWTRSDSPALPHDRWLDRTLLDPRETGDEGLDPWRFRLASSFETLAEVGQVPIVPPYLHLEVETEGYLPFSGRYILGDEPLCPIGDVVLEPPEDDLVLAPGHGLPDVLADCGVGRPEFDERIPVVTSWPGAAGELHLHLGEGTGLAGASLLMLTSPGRSPAGFQRTDTGWYQRLPDAEYRVHVVLDPLPTGVDGLHVGWDWLGEEGYLAWIPAREVGGQRAFDFVLPSEGARLWWSRGSRMVRDEGAARPGEGHVDLRPGASAVRLR